MNFRGILSKSSLKSSSSGKSLTHSQEVLKLQSEIESLRETIDSLKVSVDSRDAAIGTLAREKEKIYVELKSAQRTNRNVHQQLIDERDIHSKEKEFLINEIKRLSNRNEHEIDAQQNEEGCEDQYKSLFDELKAKDEVIYNIGAKYIKIKSTKMSLQKKLEKLQIQNKKTCENIIFLLQDNRKMLDNLLENLLKSSTVSPNSKKYLNLLQVNANLHYENAQLKIYLSAKDSTDFLHPESNHTKEPPVKLYSSEKPNIKNSRAKCQIQRHRTVRSKLKSPMNHITHLRRDLYRSASDSCIVRKNLSELMNINNIN